MKTPAAPADDIAPQFARAILIFIVVLFLVRNIPWHLDNYDQAKQAFTSFEMVQEGNLWFQHTPTGRVATKPPLAGWISTTLYFMMGGHWWDGAWRIPPLVCALTILWILWRSGCTLLAGNNIGGLLAAGAFGLNAFTPRLATLVRTDMMLTLIIFVTGWLIWKKVRHRDVWSTADKWMLFLLVLAAMLTKGPIVYAFLLPGLVAFAFLVAAFDLATMRGAAGGLGSARWRSLRRGRGSGCA
jgi:4-amino-4-deoxy-L-arabinose transferase-like glycosyltransferase